MADKLGYDVSDLRNQATAIDSVADNLQSSKESLVSHLATLRGDWVSTASTRFFEKIDTDWDVAIDEYVSMLRDLSSALSEAADKYDPLEDEYQRISLG